MKKLILIILTILSIMPVSWAETEDNFIHDDKPKLIDVDETTKYNRAIMYLKNNEIVQGYKENNGTYTFKPEQTINRAELLKILLEGTKTFSITEETENNNETSPLLGETERGNYQNCFTDVKNEWFAPYVCYAKDKGIIKGYADGSFKPEQNIAFTEAAKMITNIMGLEVAKVEENAPWYKQYVLPLTENKRVPRSITTFDKDITRGEMAEMVWRVREEERLKEGDDYVAEIRRDWMSYAGIELKMKNVELFSEKYRTVREWGGERKEKNEFDPLKFWESEISEVEYVFYCFDAAECRVFRTLENDDFEIKLYAGNAEGATLPGYVLIKDKKNDRYFISNKSVIEAQFDTNNKNLFLSWRESVVYHSEGVIEPRLANFAKFINLSVNEIIQKSWDNNGMSATESFSSLAKVSLEDMSIKNHFISFGGEEIKIEENKIFFTKYGLLDRYTEFPYDKGTLESCWINRNYHEYCDKLRIPIVTLDINTFKKIDESYINKIGALHEFDFTYNK